MSFLIRAAVPFPVTLSAIDSLAISFQSRVFYYRYYYLVLCTLFRVLFILYIYFIQFIVKFIVKIYVVTNVTCNNPFIKIRNMSATLVMEKESVLQFHK